MNNLQVNATLQRGKYKIITILGQGGFGITYLAEQAMLERKVAIKEFFMKEFCERNGQTTRVTLGTESSRETVIRFREKFLKEARNIAKLNHPNIVRIIDVFEENETAYYVMDYCEKGSLAEKVKEQGCMSESVATRYIIQVAEALGYIHHKNMNHLDIKPSNIMLNGKNNIVLIDFGLSKQYNISGQQTSTTPVGISEGYAPMEQYKQGGVGEFSPETDIYALGATFFNLLTGITPPSASDVNEDGVPVDELKVKGVSQKAINVICKAMEPRKRDRMKKVRLFIDGLQGEFSLVSQDDEEATVPFGGNQQSGNERKYKAAEVKVEKEAKKEDERKKNETEEQCLHEKKTPKKQGGSTKKRLLMIAVVSVIFCGITFMFCGSNIDSQTYMVGDVSFGMVKVEGGTFTMGSTNGESDEKPAHRVTLSSFYIGKTEVTQALWEAVMGESPSLFFEKKGLSNYVDNNYPMYGLAWNDCKTFISKLNAVTGKNFRLPTEAEWEYACRGGNRSKNYEYSGSDTPDNVAWNYNNSASGINASPELHKVGSKKANELGLYDMSGNVWELCSDWYGSYSHNSQINPKGPDSGTCHVYRGGSFMGVPGNCRSLTRAYDGFSYYEDNGLRLCLSE